MSLACLGKTAYAHLSLLPKNITTLSKTEIQLRTPWREWLHYKRKPRTREHKVSRQRPCGRGVPRPLTFYVVYATVALELAPRQPEGGESDDLCHDSRLSRQGNHGRGHPRFEHYRQYSRDVPAVDGRAGA